MIKAIYEFQQSKGMTHRTDIGKITKGSVSDIEFSPQWTQLARKHFDKLNKTHTFIYKGVTQDNTYVFDYYVSGEHPQMGIPAITLTLKEVKGVVEASFDGKSKAYLPLAIKDTILVKEIGNLFKKTDRAYLPVEQYNLILHGMAKRAAQEQADRNSIGAWLKRRVKNLAGLLGIIYVYNLGIVSNSLSGALTNFNGESIFLLALKKMASAINFALA